MNSATEFQLIGSTLGRVRIDEQIGEGAAGTVFRGHHTSLGMDVAVKVLKSKDSQNKTYRERFKREAQLTARLDHPGLVRVIDFGEEHDVLYLVMDYVDGFTLERYMRHRKQALNEETVIKLLLSICAGMHAAHAANIIHRDLKPANILISRAGKLKIADLGLARQDDLPSLTRDKVAVGSPAYMSPESLTAGIEIDYRSDIYAIGVIGYLLAFHQLPYVGSVAQTIQGHLAGNARWDLPTTCSRDCIKIIRKLMAHDPNGRYQKAADAAMDLKKLLSLHLKKNRKRTQRGTPGSASKPSASGSTDFSGIVAFLESRIGTHTSEHDGGQVVHTTFRERVILWLILICILALIIGGYVFS